MRNESFVIVFQKSLDAEEGGWGWGGARVCESKLQEEASAFRNCWSESPASGRARPIPCIGSIFQFSHTAVRPQALILTRKPNEKINDYSIFSNGSRDLISFTFSLVSRYLYLRSSLSSQFWRQFHSL